MAAQANPSHTPIPNPISAIPHISPALTPPSSNTAALASALRDMCAPAIQELDLSIVAARQSQTELWNEMERVSAGKSLMSLVVTEDTEWRIQRDFIFDIVHFLSQSNPPPIFLHPYT